LIEEEKMQKQTQNSGM